MKPNWKYAPAWANFLAQDITGFWHWFKDAPAQNSKIPSTNSTGVKGVSITKAGKFRAEVIHKKKLYLLGCAFNTIAEAEKAVIMKRNELHGEFANHG